MFTGLPSAVYAIYAMDDGSCARNVWLAVAVFFVLLLLLQCVVHRRSFSVHRDYRRKNVIIFVNSQQYLYANNAHGYTYTRAKIYT